MEHVELSRPSRGAAMWTFRHPIRILVSLTLASWITAPLCHGADQDVDSASGPIAERDAMPPEHPITDFFPSDVTSPLDDLSSLGFKPEIEEMIRKILSDPKAAEEARRRSFLTPPARDPLAGRFRPTGHGVPGFVLVAIAIGLAVTVLEEIMANRRLEPSSRRDGAGESDEAGSAPNARDQ